MKSPDPPFLEIAFYFADLPEEEALRRLVKALEAKGAKFTGMGSAHRMTGIQMRRFASILDEPLVPVTVRDATDMARLQIEREVRLVQVHMEYASGTMLRVDETVGFLSISEEAAHTDRHPLVIRTEGAMFSGSPSQGVRPRAMEIGRRAYQRFHDLVKMLHPAYGAITVDLALECPTDLRRDPRSLAFRDFFVSESYLGSSKSNAIRKLFIGAYLAPLADGLYVSCNKEFHPDEESMDAEQAQWLSVEVAKLIASVS